MSRDFDSQSGLFSFFAFPFLCQAVCFVFHVCVFRYNRNLGPYPNNDYVSQV